MRKSFQNASCALLALVMLVGYTVSIEAHTLIPACGGPAHIAQDLSELAHANVLIPFLPNKRLYFSTRRVKPEFWNICVNSSTDTGNGWSGIISTTSFHNL